MKTPQVFVKPRKVNALKVSNITSKNISEILKITPSNWGHFKVHFEITAYFQFYYTSFPPDILFELLL